ncbi:LysR family transcriptional regulator [Diaminobutyricibacter tongyongensis]|uniref:LysR family transcriptional regulator n=1 Tax=Leifsonia tongyongensis TaxID=1268043 RepID=A0A6L9XZI6_9MICO|nr:LysR family transcriptional regulator [Diaminobutyricibacter tongyongensis]NEN06444.1 LysR family transcriptional regulator [Diaminobutyricibacter tongyongensis]
MLFRQLEYFVAIAREQHFGRAAEASYVSQPALSSAIHKLEQELNVTLINRGHAFEGLTPEGERLVIWAKRILAEHDAFKAEVRAVQSGLTGTLRVGATPTASTTVSLPVEAFAAIHPLAKVRVQTRLSADDLVRMLSEFELDAAVMAAGPADEAGLETVPLYDEDYVLIVPRELLPDRGTSMPWVEAHRLPLAMLDQRMHSRKLIDQAFADQGLVLDPQVETDSIASLYALVRTGRWASIVPSNWLFPRGGPTGPDVVTMAEPVARQRIVVAIGSREPGSLIARSFAKTAAALSLNELFAIGPSATRTP